jgi:hypothetical protein
MAKKAKDSTPGIYRKGRRRILTAEQSEQRAQEVSRSFEFAPILDVIEQQCIAIIRPHVKEGNGVLLDLGDGMQSYSEKKGAPPVVHDAISAMGQIQMIRAHLGEDGGNIRAVGLFALRLGMLCERMSVRPYEGHVRQARKARANLLDTSMSENEKASRARRWRAQLLSLMSYTGRGLKFSDAVKEIAGERNVDHLRRELKDAGITKATMRRAVEAEMGIEKT